MKNSRKSQIPVLIVLAISLVISFLFVLQKNLMLSRVWRYRDRIFYQGSGLTIFLEYGLFVIAICAIIYYIVFSEKKIFSIVISIVAIVIDMLINFYIYECCMSLRYVNIFTRIPKGLFWKHFWLINKNIMNHADCGGIFFALLIIFVALIVGFKKSPKTIKISKQREQKYNHMKTDMIVSSESYCSLLKHILLLLFTCGIWYLIWIYRMTGYTNAAEGEEYRNPTKKLLLCMFVPFYSIYWTYKTAQRVDKMAAAKGVSSDMTTLCLILAIFVAIIPPILLQDVMNKIATADNTQPVFDQKAADVKETKIDTADELKKFKELLDSGVITQEEFDAKKKQLLGL